MLKNPSPRHMKTESFYFNNGRTRNEQ